MDIERLNSADIEHAVQITEGIWWVGHYLPDDAFQCHVYLIVHGDQSVLIDPGSYLTIDTTLRKIEEVTPFENIRYFICHHQDPDITSSMKVLDEWITRDDAVLVTDWRAEALLKHYDLDVPFWRVEDHDWRLDLGGRVLRFVLTPYLHFPGAFCSFDERTGVLFSSDLFGGFTEDWSLVARDESYFEAMRPFHQHYMPSRDILVASLRKLEQLPIRLIAPQHGSLIPGHLVMPMIEGLKDLDCGLYLLTQDDMDIAHLSLINQILQEIMAVLTHQSDFREISSELLRIARQLLPVESLEYFAEGEGDGSSLWLSASNDYRGERRVLGREWTEMFGLNAESWKECYGSPFHIARVENLATAAAEPFTGEVLVLPLCSPSQKLVHGVAVFPLSAPVTIDKEVERMLEHLRMPLGVAVERETIYCLLNLEHRQLYQRSIHDPLTGLYNRIHLNDSIERLFEIHDRDPTAAVAVALFDIDFFKSINDTYGHNAGDEVLKRVAEVMRQGTRGSDLPVRMGGEEFAVFLVGSSALHARKVSERIREMVEELRFEAPMAERTVTISAGIAYRKVGEGLEAFLGRADTALYEAKNGGRNRVCMAT